MESFYVPHKKPSREDLKAWRKNVLTLNPSRRFRHTANLEKRREIDDMRSFRIAVLATQAAILFTGKRFGITPDQLEGLQENHDLYKRLNGIEGIATKLDVQSLDQGIKGSQGDLQERIKEFGSNIYDEKPPRSFFQYLWEACKDLTLVILAICAVVALAVGIPTKGLTEGWYDGAGILLSLLLVVFVTAISDYRQSFQFQNLENEKKKIYIDVVRNGSRSKVPIFDLVVGDVVVLSMGGQIPADGLFLSGFSLEIDQSSLTGESEPLRPSGEKPFLLAGSMVHYGYGRMMITAVGMRTEWGKLMSKLSEGGSNETPLQVWLNGVTNIIGKIGFVFAFLTFCILAIRFFLAKHEEGFPLWRMEYLLKIVNYFAVAVTIIVVAVPEGLPLAVTLSLAYAMKHMIADKALVRNLAACETMGSATCICSDKTGTLTTNCMTVVKVFSAGQITNTKGLKMYLSEKAIDLLIENVFFNTSGELVQIGDRQHVYGSPTEKALLAMGFSLGGDFGEVRSRYEIVQVVPFSSLEKKMFVVVYMGNGRYRCFCKGAAEIVLNMCNKWMLKGTEAIPLDDFERQRLERVIQEFSQDSLRTLSLAYADYENLKDADEGISKSNFIFMGFVGIKDPVRPEVKDAVKTCIKAGIKVCMITGDNLETAKAIARECGILTDDKLAAEGPAFRHWSLREKLERIPKLQVLARSSPMDKLLLVQHLQDQHEVVSVTGDGTNDGPALREADIGLAMGISGTEVAKSSADVIILDDNFSTIVNVAKWGRSVYTNIQKFVQFQLTANVVALTVNFVSACVSGQAPLTAVQLLWVNLIMDTLGALALATQSPYDALMDNPPVGRHGQIITNVMWRNILGQAAYQLTVLWLLQFNGENLLHIHGESSKATLKTIIFNAFVFCQLFNEINSREMVKVNVFSNMFTDSVFLSVMTFSVFFQVMMVEFLGQFANTVPLNAKYWIISVLIGFGTIFVGTLTKFIPVPSKPFFEFFKMQRISEHNGYRSLPSV